MQHGSEYVENHSTSPHLAAPRNLSVDLSNRGLGLAAESNSRVDVRGHVDHALGSQIAAVLGRASDADVEVRLQSLNLSGNGLDAESAGGIVGVLHDHPEIALLRLSDNNLGDVGARLLCDGVAKAARAVTVVDGEPLGLMMLDLSRNNVRADGAMALAEFVVRNGALVVPRLDTLMMAGNPLGDAGAHAIASAITDAVTNVAGRFALAPSAALKLRHLDLFACDLGESGAQALQAAEAIAQRAGATLRITGLASVPDTAQHHTRALSPKTSRRSASPAETPSTTIAPPGIESPPLRTTWSFRRTGTAANDGGTFAGENAPSDAQPPTAIDVSGAASQHEQGTASAQHATKSSVSPSITMTLPPISEDTAEEGAASTIAGGVPAAFLETDLGPPAGQNGAVVELFHQYVSSQVEAAVADRTAMLEALVHQMHTELSTLRAQAPMARPQPPVVAPGKPAPALRAQSPRSNLRVLNSNATASPPSEQPTAASKLVTAASSQDIWAASLRGSGSTGRATSPRRVAAAPPPPSANTARVASPRRGGAGQTATAGRGAGRLDAPTGARPAGAQHASTGSPSKAPGRASAGTAAATAARAAALRRMHTLGDVDADAVLINSDDLDNADSLLLETDPKAWRARSPGRAAETHAQPTTGIPTPALAVSEPAQSVASAKTAPRTAVARVPGPYTADVPSPARAVAQGLPPPPPSFYGASPDLARSLRTAASKSQLPPQPPPGMSPAPVEQVAHSAPATRVDARSVAGASAAASRASSPRHLRPFETHGTTDPLARSAVLPSSSTTRRGHISIADVANSLHAQAAGRRSPTRSPSRISLQRASSPRRLGGAGGTTAIHSPAFAPQEIAGASATALLHRFGSMRPGEVADAVVSVDAPVGAGSGSISVVPSSAASLRSAVGGVSSADIRVLQRMQAHAINVLNSTAAIMGNNSASAGASFRTGSVDLVQQDNRVSTGTEPEAVRSASSKRSRPDLRVLVQGDVDRAVTSAPLASATGTSKAEDAHALYRAVSHAYMVADATGATSTLSVPGSPRTASPRRAPSIAGSMESRVAVAPGAGRVSPRGAPPPSDAFSATILHSFDQAKSGAATSKAMQVWSASLRSSYDPGKPVSQEELDGHVHARLQRVRSRSPSMRDMKAAITALPRTASRSPKTGVRYVDSAQRVVEAAELAHQAAMHTPVSTAPATVAADTEAAAAPATKPRSPATPARSHSPPSSAYDAIRARAIQQIARTPISGGPHDGQRSHFSDMPASGTAPASQQVVPDRADATVLDTGVLCHSRSDSTDEAHSAVSAAALAAAAVALREADHAVMGAMVAPDSPESIMSLSRAHRDKALA